MLRVLTAADHRHIHSQVTTIAASRSFHNRGSMKHVTPMCRSPGLADPAMEREIAAAYRRGAPWSWRHERGDPEHH